ncbi:arylsulfatase b-like [Plakobranchus ocellatus]|uniref:Arylsulfatase b-like n=1 Tax=Plakobranchus ocellatus TaxID=259542 RepID=A0AAV3Y2V8_9GAST|nr:arylsulfatase b-like [Plakobranchus ocellatus]
MAGYSSLVTAVCLTVVLTIRASHATTAPPNIVFIIVDDLGWNDVGFNNPAIKSPNLDRLAKDGVILNQNYVQPVCSPSISSGADDGDISVSYGTADGIWGSVTGNARRLTEALIPSTAISAPRRITTPKNSVNKTNIVC